MNETLPSDDGGCVVREESADAEAEERDMGSFGGRPEVQVAQALLKLTSVILMYVHTQRSPVAEHYEMDPACQVVTRPGQEDRHRRREAWVDVVNRSWAAWLCNSVSIKCCSRSGCARGTYKHA